MEKASRSEGEERPVSSLREACVQSPPFPALPWTGLMRKLHAVCVDFNNLNDIGMHRAHHVQPNLVEKGRSVILSPLALIGSLCQPDWDS